MWSICRCLIILFYRGKSLVVLEWLSGLVGYFLLLSISVRVCLRGYFLDFGFGGFLS